MVQYRFTTSLFPAIRMYPSIKSAVAAAMYLLLNHGGDHGGEISRVENGKTIKLYCHDKKYDERHYVIIKAAK